MQGQKYEQVPPKDGHQALWSESFFQITAKGMKGFGQFGGVLAPYCRDRVAGAQQHRSQEWTLIAHQASSVAVRHVAEPVDKPAQMIQTIANFANMTVANIPVNLAWSVANQPISQNNLVLFALSPDMHANALLLQRSSS